MEKITLKQNRMNPNQVNNVLKEIPPNDHIGKVIKITVGIFLWVRIIKASVELYHKIEDRKIQKMKDTQ